MKYFYCSIIRLFFIYLFNEKLVNQDNRDIRLTTRDKRQTANNKDKS
jgi:hypothetical protein